MTSKNMIFLAAIMGREEGLAECRWVGRDVPRITRKSRTVRWQLTVPSFLAVISAKNSLFPGLFPSRFRIDSNCARIEASLAAIGAQKEVRPDWRRIGRDSPHDRPGIADQSLEINGALLGPNRC